MKVVFCNQLTEMLGVQTLSACLKAAGHETALVFEPNLFATGAIKEPGLIELMSNDGLVVEDILGEEPDLVGFPIEINGYHWALKIASALRARRPDLPIIMGGIHATICPEVVIERPEVDYVAVGEAEISLVELCDILAGRKKGDPTKVEGIWARERDGTQHRNGSRPDYGNLDDFPFYDKSLYYEKLPGLASEYMTTISRGCPYNCSFCFYNAVHEIVGNRKVRLRSPSHVLEELKQAKAAYPQMEAVLFHDDIFPVRTSWLAEFAPRYKEEIGLPYSCITYPTLVTEQMADLLADSGCRTVIMGVQSTNENIRRNVMERFEKNDQILAAIRRLRERDVFVTCDHILGTPGETRADQDKSLLFYADAGPNIVKPLPLTYLPKTGMTRLAIEEGIISEEDEDDAAHGYLNSLMFKGHGYDTEWRAYFLMYGLKPLLSKRLFVRLVQGGHHHALARLPSRYGLDPLIFFVPRLMNGVMFGYDMRAKYLAWRFLEMMQYSMARKVRSKRRGLRAQVGGSSHSAPFGSRVTARLLRNRRRANGTERVLPGQGFASRVGLSGRSPETVSDTEHPHSAA